MRANLKRFQQDVRQLLRVLETATSEAGRGQLPEAAASVRRVARSIGTAAGDHGLVEIGQRAEDVVSAHTHEELVARAKALLSIAASRPVAAAAGTARILAVEDDPVSARVLRASIEKGGLQLVVTDCATEARRLLGELSFDLVFLDLVLPDADGRDLLVAWRQLPATADIPVIVCSAIPARRAEMECLALGADAYLEKPLRPAVVRSTVSRLLTEEGGDRLESAAADVSGRPPLSESMENAGRPLHLAPAGGPERVVVPGQVQLPTLRKVLLVEDDRVTARLVTHRLAKDGFEVLLCDHGQAAFEVAGTERVDLAIVDVKLPGMDGFELLERVRRLPHFEGVPVIMLTSMGREADVVRGFELGADDYVLKPFSPVELLARIHRLLDDRGVSRGS